MVVKLRLKQLMKEQKLSAPKLAERSGVPLPSIKSIFSGQSKNPTAATLGALAKALDCDISDLLGSEKMVKPAQELQSGQDHLFLEVLNIINQIASEREIDLVQNQEFKKACVNRIYSSLVEKSMDHVDIIYAQWVFDNEWGN